MEAFLFVLAFWLLPYAVAWGAYHVLESAENYFPAYNSLQLPYVTTSTVVSHVPERKMISTRRYK